MPRARPWSIDADSMSTNDRRKMAKCMIRASAGLYGLDRTTVLLCTLRLSWLIYHMIKSLRARRVTAARGLGSTQEKKRKSKRKSDLLKERAQTLVYATHDSQWRTGRGHG